MLQEAIYKSFKYVVGFDTEFRGSIKDGERNQVICFVYKDFKTGKYTKTYGKDLKKLPFPKKSTLFIAHNVGAETHSMLSMNMGRAKYLWDTMIEDKKLFGGRVKGHGLLHVANRYDLDGVISENLKKYYIDLILSKENYTTDELNKIINYCKSDVDTLEKVFYKQLESIEQINSEDGPRDIISRALFSGAAMAVTAQVEFTGIPINKKLLDLLTHNFPRVRKEIIKDINKRLNIYDEHGGEYKFNLKKFEKLIIKNKLYNYWPKTKTGQCKKDEKTILRFAEDNQDISDYYFATEFVDAQKLKGFVVGPDSRARTPLTMYGLKTGRTNQSTALYPFNCAKPLRNIIAPDDKQKIGINFDYKAQEISIAAYLSQDPNMMAAYESGDIYIKTAQLTGAVPSYATKESHPVERNKYKTVLLATLYGQGIKSLAERLGITELESADLQSKIKNTYSVYFRWVDQLVNRFSMQGYMTAKFGWRYWLTPGESINPRTMYNFAIQGNGSEMLRLAAIGVCDAGVELNALIHDGILVQVPRKNLRKHLIKVKKILIDASKKILNRNKSTNYFCDVDFQCIRTAMVQGETEQKKWNRIMSILNKHTRGEITHAR